MNSLELFGFDRTSFRILTIKAGRFSGSLLALDWETPYTFDIFYIIGISAVLKT